MTPSMLCCSCRAARGRGGKRGSHRDPPLPKQVIEYYRECVVSFHGPCAGGKKKKGAFLGVCSAKAENVKKGYLVPAAVAPSRREGGEGRGPSGRKNRKRSEVQEKKKRDRKSPILSSRCARKGRRDRIFSHLLLAVKENTGKRSVEGGSEMAFRIQKRRRASPSTEKKGRKKGKRESTNPTLFFITRDRSRPSCQGASAPPPFGKGKKKKRENLPFRSASRASILSYSVEVSCTRKKRKKREMVL